MRLSSTVRLLLRQAHLIWLVSIVNIGLGFFIAGFNPLAQSISEVALETPAFAYTHRAADIIIGISICAFGVGVGKLAETRVSFSMISTWLLGVSMISAGIWTLESPLHLLYNLSIFMILVPVACALELKELIRSRPFEALCLTVSFLHILMFWFIYAGFIPSELNGLIQRIWAVVGMGWFGIAAHVILRSCESDNVATHASCKAAGA